MSDFQEINERLIDPIDIGSHNAEVDRARAEEVQRRKAAPKQVRGEDGKWPTTECEDCGEPIGEGRLELGYIDCIDCAQIKEHKGRQYAK